MGGSGGGYHRVVKVKRETLESCMTCPLCNKLLEEATTIPSCLHTFCRECICEKLSDEGMDCCPECDTELGCFPLYKLRPDHNLQDIRAKIFPFKRRKTKAPEAIPSVSPPAKRKERSLSSLMGSTLKVPMQSGFGNNSKRPRGEEVPLPTRTAEGQPQEKTSMNLISYESFAMDFLSMVPPIPDRQSMMQRPLDVNLKQVECFLSQMGLYMQRYFDLMEVLVAKYNANLKISQNSFAQVDRQRVAALQDLEVAREKARRAEELEEEMKKCEGEKKKLEEGKRKLEDEKKKMTLQLESLAAQNEKLTKAMQDNRAEISCLSEELKVLKEEAARKEREREELERKVKGAKEKARGKTWADMKDEVETHFEKLAEDLEISITKHLKEYYPDLELDHIPFRDLTYFDQEANRINALKDAEGEKGGEGVEMHEKGKRIAPEGGVAGAGAADTSAAASTGVW